MNIQKMTPSAVILAAAAIYFFTSPHDGNFWWSDASRHAMDGIFYADFFKALPLTDPKQYSFDYYSRYPALTILFYPPLFAVIEAAFFTVFGHTHAVAQITVTFFVFILGLGAYHLAKRHLSSTQALAVTLIFLGSNEIAFWGRQVMLDIPAYAFLLWAAIAYLKYTDTQRNIFLYLGTALFAMGIYTKLNIAFMAPVFFAAITLKLGKKVLNKHILISAILFTISMLPWLFITLKFGKVNIDAVAGGQVDHELSRTSLENWTYYAKLIPEQIGLIPTALCSLYILFITVRKDWQSNKIDVFFIISWLIFGYIVFSLITLKESRHDIFILYPVALCSVLFIEKSVKSRTISNTTSSLLAAGLFAKSLFFTDIPYVNGYKEAAENIARTIPANSTVLFSGYRDGSFIFNIKTYQDRPDISVLRADKLLLKVAIKREMGVEEKKLSESEIINIINKNGVTYLVVDPEFWIDLPIMQKLQKVLTYPQFQKIQTINIESNKPIKDKQLVIYKNTGNIEKRTGPITIEIPSIGIEITGTNGQRIQK